MAKAKQPTEYLSVRLDDTGRQHAADALAQLAVAIAELAGAPEEQVAAALAQLTDAIAESPGAPEAPVDPAEDLARLHALHEQIFDCTLVLRRESAWVRRLGVCEALDVGGLTYQQAGAALGDLARQRVHQIRTEEPPRGQPLRMMSGEWLTRLRGQRDEGGTGD